MTRDLEDALFHFAPQRTSEFSGKSTVVLEKVVLRVRPPLFIRIKSAGSDPYHQKGMVQLTSSAR